MINHDYVSSTSLRQKCFKAYYTGMFANILLIVQDCDLFSALPGWTLSGVRGRVGSVSRATVHEGHAQQTG